LTATPFAYSLDKINITVTSQGMSMKKRFCVKLVVLIGLIFFALGCTQDTEVKETPAAVDEVNETQATAIKTPLAGDRDNTNKSKPKKVDSDVAVSVDGKVLKKSELDKDVAALMKAYADRIPKDKTSEVRADVRTRFIENFIVRTLLQNEIEKRNIQASAKEINEVVEEIKGNLPSGKDLADFLKANNMSEEEFSERMASDVKIKKMIMQELGKKAKPTRREIKKFYNDHIDNFIIPENVHVRHILITIADKDSDKVKEQKKSKMEDIRTQIIVGADFAELAAKNSECPSRENGGDLGNITKGQTVEPFEDAAFSQDIDEIGPVVTTDYGYHIIQVLEKNKEVKIALKEVRQNISDYLMEQKQSEAFAALMEKLRAKADIVVN